MSYFFPPVTPEYTSDYNKSLELGTGEVAALDDSVKSDNNYGNCVPRGEDNPNLNPCVRNKDNKLIPNSRYPKACRYFPQYLGPGVDCPTICPEACVELWENCPAGTGVLASVVHTKTFQHVLQLSGKSVPPTPENPGGINPMFDSNKHYLSYTECYSFGTEFCELPETRMQVVDGENRCFKDCPIGTTQDPLDPLTCISDAGLNIQCNQQYFSPFANGCTKKPLPTQKSASCPTGYESFLNNQFAVEWCMATCPSGYFHDLNYSSCIANCQNSSDDPADWSHPDNYSAFRDALDYYAYSASAVGYRCNDPTKPCPNALNPGRCPVPRYQTPESQYANTYQSVSRPKGMPSRQFSSSSFPTEARTENDNLAYQPLLKNALQKLENNGSVDSYPVPTIQIVCPQDMVIALPNTDEKAGFCYDVCDPLFNSAEICRNTGQVRQGTTEPALQCQDAEIQNICIAKCPDGWRSKVISSGKQPVYTCEYIYPNNVVPSDPNLFVDCPSNGTFLVQTLGDTVGPDGNPLPPTPDICVRKIYQRNESCPLNYTYAETATGPTCLENCQDGTMPIEIILNGVPTIFCIGSGPQTGAERYAQSLDSMYNNVGNTKQPGSQLIRKNQTTGYGYDPIDMFAASNSSATNSSITTLGVIFGVIVLILFLQRLFR